MDERCIFRRGYAVMRWGEFFRGKHEDFSGQGGVLLPGGKVLGNIFRV